MKQVGKKSNSPYEQGYIYAPYIIIESTPIIEGSMSKRWLRAIEVRKRNDKLEKILNKINGNL